MANFLCARGGRWALVKAIHKLTHYPITIVLIKCPMQFHQNGWGWMKSQIIFRGEFFLTDNWQKSENISGWVQTQFSLPDLAISNGPSPTPWSSSPSLFVRVQTQCTFVSVLFDSSPQRIVSWDFYERTTFYPTLVQGGFFLTLSVSK